MGLYGGLIVRPTTDPTSGYGDAASDFTTEELLIVSEIDPALNGAPAGFDMQDYHPTYWLFNGHAHPNIPCHLRGGRQQGPAPLHQRRPAQPVGWRARHAPDRGGRRRARPQPSIPGRRRDDPGGGHPRRGRDDPGRCGRHQAAIQSTAGHTDNAGASSGGIVAFGGMLALIDVSAAPAGDLAGPRRADSP